MKSPWPVLLAIAALVSVVVSNSRLHTRIDGLEKQMERERELSDHRFDSSLQLLSYYRDRLDLRELEAKSKAGGSNEVGVWGDDCP